MAADPGLERLAAIRGPLLRLHAAVLAAERAEHERTWGPVAGGEFLQCVVEGGPHAWLRPLTSALADVDEALAAAERGEPPPPGEAERLVAGLRELVAPPRAGTAFGDRYLALLQERPDVVLAHGGLARLVAERRPADG
jgi:hypothetical protein